MNDTIEKLYAKYLHLTDGDKAAAANLALAATFLSGRNEAPTIPAGVPLTVKEAAAQLRVSTPHLRVVRDGRFAGLQGRPISPHCP